MYSMANSLSPMMFRKSKAKASGTRNERMRSRSMENIMSEEPVEGKKKKKEKRGRANTEVPPRSESPLWAEIPLVKSMSPVVVCVLPAMSMDFVCSALLAMGATPLITDDPLDMEKDLQNAKAVVVDVGASRDLLDTFMEQWVVDMCPFILVASGAGSSNRRKELAQQLTSDCGPTAITGRLGDIYALAQSVIETASSHSDSSEDEEQRKTLADKRSQSVPNAPKVVLDNGDTTRLEKSLPPAMRRMKFRGERPSISPSASPHGSPHSSPHRSPRRSPHGSPPHSPPHASPHRSPRHSPRASPHHSPTSSPPRGVRKRIQSGPILRVNSVLPMVHMKGQFRHATMDQCPVDEAVEYGQLLAAHTNAFIHLYETNVVTSGEVVVEITNNQLGMGNLHSTLPCAGAVMAAVLACVEEQGEDIALKHCSHALGVYYVAAEEGACEASSSQRGVVSPGSLRQYFLDALHYLDERQVHTKAQIYAHSAGTKCVVP